VSESYQQYYKAKLEGALLYQDFVTDTFYQFGIPVNQYSSKAYQNGVGESRSGIEIKFDEKSGQTHNLWIEIAEKAKPRAGDYAVSGIYRLDNTWLYAIGDYDTIYAIPKKFLVLLHKSGKYRVLENNTKTSEGFLLPCGEAEKFAAFVIYPKAKKAVSRLVESLSLSGKELHQLVLNAKLGQLSLFD